MSAGDDIIVVRHPNARRAKLSINPTSGEVRLTLPLRSAAGPALRWAEQQRPWIDQQRARLPRPLAIVHGSEIIVAGEALTIDWDVSAPRRVVRSTGRLRCGGPSDRLQYRIVAWLRREALTVLSAETAEFATRLNVTIASVAVGDAQGRWGSCSASGSIRYSWRLVLAPNFVRRATVAHEVAHRLHMNHGTAFHAVVESLVGSDAAAARVWLRKHGAELHWFGRAV